jgi:drug/metabolite transporter (DMT)-like permease
MPKSKANPALGWFFTLLSSLLFGLNAATSKVVVQAHISPELVVIFRSGSSALLAGLVLLLVNRRAFKVTPKQIPKLVIFGIGGIALMQWSYTNAVSLLPVGISLLFEYTAAIITPVVMWIIYKRRPSTNLWWGAGIALAGLVVVSQIWNSNLNPLGVFFGFMAALCVVFYFVMGDFVQRDRDSLSTLFYAMLISCTFWLIVRHPSMASLPDLTGQLDLTGHLAGLKVPTWLVLLWFCVMGSFLPMLMGFAALKNLSPTYVGIGSISEVIWAFVFGWLWLGEAMGGIQVIGAVLVVAGIVLAQSGSAKKQEQ